MSKALKTAAVAAVAAGALIATLTACAPADSEGTAADRAVASEEAKKADKAAASEDKKAEPTKKAAPKMTKAQKNAVGAARNYLEFAAFSKKGLIEQLSSDAGDGFAKADATFAVNYLDVNWNQQAVKAAKNYLDISSFSRKGLIDQLESSAGDGFTHAQAVYGVKKNGL
jgi:hypothetical protein